MAGGRALFDVKAPQAGIAVLGGRVDSSNAVVAGKGFSVSKAGTGRYTITLDHHYPGLISAVPGLEVNGNGNVTNMQAQLTDDSVGSGSKTLEFTVFDLASDATSLSAADLAAGEQLHFTLILKSINT